MEGKCRVQQRMLKCKTIIDGKNHKIKQKTIGYHNDKIRQGNYSRRSLIWTFWTLETTSDRGDIQESGSCEHTGHMGRMRWERADKWGSDISTGGRTRSGTMAWDKGRVQESIYDDTAAPDWWEEGWQTKETSCYSVRKQGVKARDTSKDRIIFIANCFLLWYYRNAKRIKYWKTTLHGRRVRFQ